MSETVEIQDAVAPEADPVEVATAALKEQFPQDIADDTRDRYTGLIVSADRLVEVGEYVRDDLGFDISPRSRALILLTTTSWRSYTTRSALRRGAGRLCSRSRWTETSQKCRRLFQYGLVRLSRSARLGIYMACSLKAILI
jgi:hypothetical protein